MRKTLIIASLIVILILVLLLSMFIVSTQQEGYTGANTVGSDTGITLNDITIVRNVLIGKNDNLTIETISKMGIQDPFFLKVLNSNASNTEKVAQLRLLVSLIISNSRTKDDVISSYLDKNVYLDINSSIKNNTSSTTTTPFPTITTPFPTTTTPFPTITTPFPTTAMPTASQPSGRICDYSFDRADDSNNIFNATSSVHDLSVVNVGVDSSTIDIVRKQLTIPYSLYQNSASKTNYSYYVNNANEQIRKLTGSFSVSFWIYINSNVPSSYGTVWCLYNDTNNNLITYSQMTSGEPIICITFSDRRFYINAVAYEKDTYNHIVLTCNESDGTSTIQMYVNGVLYNFNGSNFSGNMQDITWNGNNSITLTNNLFNGSNTTLYVLGGPPGKGITWPADSSIHSQGFNGYLGKMTIYNRALTLDDVTFLKSIR